MKEFGELCHKYVKRDLMEELGWAACYTHKGYMNAENEDYYRWLAYAAYYRIKELEKMVDDAESLLAADKDGGE